MQVYEIFHIQSPLFSQFFAIVNSNYQHCFICLQKFRSRTWQVIKWKSRSALALADTLNPFTVCNWLHFTEAVPRLAVLLVVRYLTCQLSWLAIALVTNCQVASWPVRICPDRYGTKRERPQGLQFTCVRSFTCKNKLQNLQADFSNVCLSCETATNQAQISKSSLPIMVNDVSPHVSVELKHLGR